MSGGCNGSANKYSASQIPTSAVKYTLLSSDTEQKTCLSRITAQKNLKQKFIGLIVIIVVVIISVVYSCTSCDWQCSNLCMKSSDPLKYGNQSRVFVAKGKFQKRLPHCIIIGVRKCGTRALLEYLGLHPEIVASYQEQHFFNKYENYKKGLGFYQSEMLPSYENQITMEKTPGYFIDIMAPERVYRMNSSIRLLLIVRDPVTRLISDYAQLAEKNQRSNLTYPPFESLIIDKNGDVNLKFKATRISIYYEHLRHWLEFFDLKQIHIVDGEALISNPYPEIYAVETFLGLHHRIPRDTFYYNETKGFYCINSKVGGEQSPCLGETKGRKHPPVDPQVIQQLREFYKPRNEKFFSLVKRTFDWQ
ncbi:heparan sulfate glucosamine 3-O-sulfotransferase 1-like [Mya arenaria]|uniref:heparan sulfate glucosamine 3-O-sulfotransferase 1-like n=1 Tax=Mya arenaria TaxID=6604 RepID=UPI0022E77EBD|nr:heparan sulfate glucosamine 3-O-sulfotransferase 1-like [Mya arenaria]